MWISSVWWCGRGDGGGTEKGTAGKSGGESCVFMRGRVGWGLDMIVA